MEERIKELMGQHVTLALRTSDVVSGVVDRVACGVVDLRDQTTVRAIDVSVVYAITFEKEVTTRERLEAFAAREAFVDEAKR